MLKCQIGGRARTRRVRRATVERKTWGRAQTPGTQRCPKQPNSDTGGEVHVVSVSISVYGHRVRDSLGAGDCKAHV